MSFRKIYASLPAQRLDSAIDQIIDQPIKLSSPHATYGPGEMLTIIRITNEAITMKPFSFVISKVARVRSEVFTRGEITLTDGSGDRAGITFFRDPGSFRRQRDALLVVQFQRNVRIITGHLQCENLVCVSCGGCAV